MGVPVNTRPSASRYPLPSRTAVLCVRASRLDEKDPCLSLVRFVRLGPSSTKVKNRPVFNKDHFMNILDYTSIKL